MLEEIQTVNFLLFSLDEKRDFYSNSILVLSCPCKTAEDFLKWETKERAWKRTNDILTIPKVSSELDLK